MTGRYGKRLTQKLLRSDSTDIGALSRKCLVAADYSEAEGRSERMIGNTGTTATKTLVGRSEALFAGLFNAPLLVR
jgi:hypothetical protein